MYMDTTYKAFVAKAAAGLMQEMVADAMAKGRINNEKSWNDNKQMYEHLAWQATQCANVLAQALQNDWTSVDHSTVFFDPQDSLTSKLEEAVYDVSQKLEDLTEKVKTLANTDEV